MPIYIWPMITLVVVCLCKLLLSDTSETITLLIVFTIIGGACAVYGVGVKKSEDDSSTES